MGFANVRVKNCSASGVLLYSDGLTFQSNPLFTNYNSDLWLGTLYNDYCFVLDEDEGGYVCYLRKTEKGELAKAKLDSSGNKIENCAIVYPVVFHYTNTNIQKYVQVNTPLEGTWYAKEACTMPVRQIIGSQVCIRSGHTFCERRGL